MTALAHVQAFAQGDLGDAIYLLKTGHVRKFRVTEEGKEITLAILGPGDVFGELALFDETRARRSRRPSIRRTSARVPSATSTG